MFAREDWTLFRSLNTLGQKAGVSVSRLGALVIKELVDNALDAGANATVEEQGDWVIITDDGPGISHDGIESLFSIRRPLTSSKIVRLPQRGALGNGLRVVMGAIYASQGEITVETGGQDDDHRLFTFTPQDDGHSACVVGRTDLKKGTRISLRLGDALKDHNLLGMAKWSIIFAKLGVQYRGKTSPWWYDGEALFEMCHATAPETSLLSILKLFRDVTTPIAQVIVDGIGCTVADQIQREKIPTLIQALRRVSKEPKPAILGKIDELGFNFRATKSGTIRAGQGPEAVLPYVIEVFCKPLREEVDEEAEKDEKDQIILMVNRTLITGNIRTWRTKSTKLVISGCGLHHSFDVPKDVPLRVIVNITTPYMPITTDGKEPDLKRFVGPLGEAIKSSASKCKRATKRDEDGTRLSQKDMITNCLNEAIAKVSSNGTFRFSLRNLYYAVRPYLEGNFEKGLDYNYFASVITGIEAELGHDIRGMYRDPRGKILHPHTGEEIALGTVAVENYKRPAWTFNKILYIEKGGFFPLLQDVNWPERHDCALMTSQGFASRAVRDVIDLLGEGTEDIYFFCIHDADASGSMIYQSLLEETKARGARTVHIVNLGLDPQEALSMGLQVETFREEGGKKLPAANYLSWDDKDWLQTQRVELNAMTSEEFLTWLDAKFEEHVGKIVPPAHVMRQKFLEQASEAVNANLTEKILEEGRHTQRLGLLINQIEVHDRDFEPVVREGIEARPEFLWSVPLNELAKVESAALVKAEKKPTKPKAKKAAK